MPKWIWHMLIGAGIGLVTNWLALVALFRPRNGLRIFGVNVAGIVPLRRQDLARSIAAQVGEQLLNEQVVEQILLSDDAKAFVKHVFVDGAVRALKRDGRTLGRMGADWLGDELFRTVEGKMCEWVEQSLTGMLRSERFVDSIVQAIEGNGRRWFSAGVGAITESEHYLPIRYGLREAFRGAIETGAVQARLLAVAQDYLTDGTSVTTPLRQIVPKHVQTAVRRAILAEGPQLADRIVAYIESPEVKERLEDGVNNIINSFGWLTRTLAKRYDRKHDIAAQVIYYVTRFLEDAESQKQLTQKIVEGVDAMLERSPGEIIDWIGRKNLDAAVESVVNKVVSMRNVDAVMDNFDRYLRTGDKRAWKEIAAIGEHLQGNWKQPLQALIKLVLSSATFERVVHETAPLVVGAMMNVQPGAIVGDIEGLDTSKAGALIEPLYERVILTHAKEAFQHIPIAPYVEDHINSLDIDQIEDMIKRVVNNELRVIVIVGGILGAIIGLVGAFI